MLRLKHVSFEREARWLMILSLAPVLGLLILIVIPALARWLSWR